MIFIKHRVNQIRELSTLMPSWGAEIDIRSHESKSLYLSHDPFMPGDDFDKWLAEFKRLGINGPIILNTKEDGLESFCIERLNRHGLGNFFFLDTTVPTLVNWTVKRGDARFAVRHSLYEPIAAVMAFAGKAKWVWVDCFGGEPPNVEDLKVLKKAFQVCLVSPELQLGLTPDTPSAIRRFSHLSSYIDAVCTKTPESW
jgi:hypothetical protein